MVNKHTRAFTILETLISMMLISIIITVSYSLFNLFGKQLHVFQEENSLVLQYNLFNTTILSDIENANDFELSEGYLLLKNYDETEVKYNISNQYILRKNHIMTDTFNLKLINHKFSAVGDNIVNNVVSVSINVLNDTINTNYFLKKDLSTIINQTYFNED